MTDAAERIEEIHSNVMAGLKDFQKATVERVHDLYESGQRRVLVSDEVGLGKTLIARGVIAKLARQKGGEGSHLVKVVYICSNSAIAGQNLSKLKIGSDSDVRTEGGGTSRLSMQHLNIFMQENDPALQKQYVQLIPLTPDTSFRMTYGSGTVDERALMYAFLRRIPELKPWLKPLNIAMRDWAYKAWEWYRGYYEDQVVRCDERSNGTYLRYMLERLTAGLKSKQQGDTTYLEELIDLCRRIKRSRYIRVNDNVILGKLRILFAQISLERLEPDLVILDEFQRFKFMIEAREDTDVGVLVKKFFSSDSARMLLLSATPYKMYSTLEEIEEGEEATHFEEFFSVMKFLQETNQEHEQFRQIWKNYSMELKELSRGNATVLTTKKTAEDALYRHICRTERISAKECADMIDTDGAKEQLCITAADIRSYLEAEKLLEGIHLNGHVPVDYVKSCPYLLSFMQDYKLKRDVTKYFQENPGELSVLNREDLWLRRQTFDRYEFIDPRNARLARVMDHVFRQNAEKLLWVPSSRSYYPLEGAFAGAEHFSKTLIFSSWEMVPRMLSCMLSYEAERRTIGILAKDSNSREARYFHEENRRFPNARLNFSVNKNTPKAMTMFTLMYPSKVLASCYDPIQCMKEGMNLQQIEQSVKEQLRSRLRWFTSEDQTGNVDHKWYYLIPLLLDPPGYVDAWLDCDKQLSAYDDETVKDQRQKGFQRHLQELRTMYKQYRSGHGDALGRMPNDLLDVLATMAIASPAVCALRAYQKYAGNQRVPHYMPSQIAKVFINRMNTPESTAVIELCYGQSEDAHWQNVLKYCKDGNLQAVFDEYVHLLTNGRNRDEKLLDRLHRDMIQSMNVRTTPYKVDTFAGFKADVTGKKEKEMNIRSHFAISFVKGIGEDDAKRKRSVRNAFNSPFRPFVLASTSIGQEGLDFHNYCRRIVHWNLPSNPIDLEQREGRINRFECLAIRQNVADRYGNIPFERDIWTEMFKAAEAEQAKGGSELIPYWGVTEQKDMVRIERIVPMYPLSRDEISYDRLVKILSLYRLTLGQARQEELVDYLLQRELEDDEIRELAVNLSPFYKCGEFESD